MELKKGDRVYRCYRGTPTHVLTIERTTKTQAIAKNYKFRKEYSKHVYIRVVGESSYSKASYCLETPELKAKLRRVNMIRKLKSVKFNDLKDSKLQELLNCLKQSDTHN